MTAEAQLPAALQQDLAQARDLQEGLLRQVDEVPAAVEVEAQCELATAVRGGFYDTIALREGRVAVVVSDVRRHGITAAGLRQGVREPVVPHQVTDHSQRYTARQTPVISRNTWPLWPCSGG